MAPVTGQATNSFKEEIMKTVLILCTGNSCRSQMAEALWSTLGGENWCCSSAGSKPSGYVHPLAMRAMAELDIDISDYRSKSLQEFQKQSFDVVVTVCGNAREACPVFPGDGVSLHWPFDDPADATGTEEEQLVMFRRVRDEIKTAIHDYLTSGKEPTR